MKQKHCVAIINQKGGVAKTTTAFNVAAVLATSGHKTLIVDMDPQASLTIAAGLDVEEFETANIGNVLLGTCTIHSIIRDLRHIENLYVAPSHIYLAHAEKQLDSMLARESALRRALSKIDGDYEYVIIDCPPTLSTVFLNAIVAADEVIIPSTCDYLSYRGIQNLLDCVNDVKEANLNEKLEVLGIIATKYKSKAKNQAEIMQVMLDNYAIIGVINDATESVSKGMYDGLPVVLCAKSPAAKAVAEEYRRITEEYIL